ncbi:MAG: Integral membrane protein MviN [Candidatus Magasanikbacteria bacterium GW2011_GWA2_45_39]|uniref:Probable lipid II flippase MurJ n=2 Tax=Candidatus Magasanikiibacteriota TaxID=1752731 RepID=A0A0G1MYC7_9BACT|nr:MAG: Integral membrane protein MviN [Candidatus Magasanikbacteria bacterium GW2011_GWA2_45_39]KKU13391.1 MAG: Integral membrane protein MviN [Candidatus Magasanikbacteria bacterium GW2011_GWC2_45_8]HBW74214.1 murein biosynthesis integral membrane protein MurJ [Candidatus Magasanikbacteria bacterium]
MNIFKFFKKESSSITSAAILLGVASLASRAVGLIRDRLLASHFGAGDTLDAYYAAFKIPDLIFTLLIVGALSTAFIPIFTKLKLSHKEKNPKENEAWKLVNNCVHLLAILLFVIVILLEVFTPQLMNVLAPGFSNEKRDLTVTLTRIMFLSPIFLSISALFGGILQSMQKFFVFAIAPIFYNIGIIIGITVLYPLLGVTGLAWGVVAGAFLHCAVQYIEARRSGYQWFWYFNIRDMNVKKILYLMIPRTMGISVSQINILIITGFASTLSAGSVAVFNLAYNLQSFPLSLFGISFALAAFPLLSREAGKKNMGQFIDTLTQTARKILFFMIPASLVFLLIRAQIVRVVLGSGSFDWNDTIQTADTLAFFALSLFAQGLVPLLSRAFFALEDSKTPFAIGVVSEIINLGAAYVGMRAYGVAGLALGASLGNIFNVVLLWLVLRIQLHTLHENLLIKSLIQISIGAMLLALVTQGIKTWLGSMLPLTSFINVAVQGGVAAAAGLVVYGFVLFVLKNEEMLDLVASLKKKFTKMDQISASDISLPS